MKYLLNLLLILIVLVGCSDKHYYMISSPHQIYHSKQDVSKIIGIKTIELPSYFSLNEIALQRDDNRIVYLKDARWAVDMGEDLTNAVIFDLQKSLKNSIIFHYPWEKRAKVDIIVSVKIKRFIAYKGFVYLDALVRVNQKDHVVTIKIPTDMKDESQIVKDMKKAFFALEDALLHYLDDIKVSKN